MDCTYEAETASKISTLSTLVLKKVDALEEAIGKAKEVSELSELAFYMKGTVFAAMNDLRAVVDELETITSAKYWPYPSYGEILYSVK